MEHLNGHALARRLLELPDEVVLTIDGDFITEVNVSTYDDIDNGNDDLPCINLETENE
jgi:hypothetical protein